MDFMTILMESDRRFFTKYQRHILYIANTRIGRRYFCLLEHPKSRKFIRIEPNALFWKQDEEVIVELRGSNRFANRIKHSARGLVRLAKAISIFGASKLLRAPDFSFLSSLPLMAGLTYTFYPDSGNPGVTTCDGVVLRTTGGLGAGTGWASIVAGAGTGNTQGSADSPVRWVADNVSSQWRIMSRGIFTFDATSLFGSTLSSATFSIAMPSLPTAPIDATPSKREFRVVGATPATGNTFVNADYSQLGSTLFGSLAFASAAGGNTYNNITLNAAGLSFISFSSVFGIGTRSGADMDGTAPTWGSFDILQYTCTFSESSGTTNDPKLTLILSAVGVGLSESLSMTELSQNVIGKILVGDKVFPLSGQTFFAEPPKHNIEKTLSAPINLTDSETNRISSAVSMNETITLNEAQSHVFGKTFSENVSAVDQPNHLVVRALSDGVTTTDSSTARQSAIRTLNESISTGDSIRRSPDKKPLENMILTDSFVKSDAKGISENISLSDSQFHYRGILMSLLDAVSHSDSVLRTPARALLDVVVWIESTIRFGSWSSRSKPTTSYSTRVKPTTTWTNRIPPS